MENLNLLDTGKRMKLSQEHIDFEKKLKSCIGATLNEVEYLEINYQEECPEPFYKTKYDKIDSVDFSIIFFTSKQKIEFHWDGSFFQYGIGFQFDSEAETATGKKWSVSQNSLWKKFIGHKIIDLNLTWEEVRVNHNLWKSEKFIYPQDLRIDFSNNKSVFISAASFLNEDDKEVMGLSDNLTVTDNESLARQIKMIN